MNGLNANNQDLLDEMKMYILSGPVSESAAKKVLEELEDHLLLAQQNGKSYEDVFGKDPKSYCDELIRNIPKPTTWERIKFIIAIPFFLIAWKLAEGMKGTLTLSLVDTGGFIVISLIVIGLFFALLRKTSFTPNKTAYLVLFSLLLFAFIIFIGVEFTEQRYLPEGPTIELHGWPAYTLGTIGLITIIVSLFASTFRHKFRSLT